PRFIVYISEEYVASTVFANSVIYAAEAYFYIFDDVRFETHVANKTFVSVNSDEVYCNDGTEIEGGNLGHRNLTMKGYFPVPPVDKHADLRDDISLLLDQVSLEVERSHHEVGAGGQGEINYEFDTLMRAADDVQLFKYIVKGAAEQAGKTATFMPKPVFGDGGSGMHCHQSLWMDGQPLFYDETGYANLSDTARWYIGGLLKHASAVLAFTNPTVNSYKRLVKGFEAPVNMLYSLGNRSAAVRIPVTG